MSIEAMKLALEALEDWNSPLDPQPDADIITALRQAIEQAQKQEAVAYKCGDAIVYIRPPIYGDTSPPQKKQAPVAWVVYSSAENDIVWAGKGKRLKQNTPLYTSPPYVATPRQRQSRSDVQPLTDEELSKLVSCTKWRSDEPMYIYAERACRATEAAHGIKGEA